MNHLNITLSSIAIIISCNASAALQSRLGGLAYYDDENDITWLADADVKGLLIWDDAMSWATSLNVAGVTGWRLPSTSNTSNCFSRPNDPACSFNESSPENEMSNLYYNVLGNLAREDANGNTQNGGGLTSTGPFSNIRSAPYWTSTVFFQGDDDTLKWYFSMHGGQRYIVPAFESLSAWAVHDGDVDPIPVPAAIWLFSSGLIGFAALSRRKRQTT